MSKSFTVKQGASRLAQASMSIALWLSTAALASAAGLPTVRGPVPETKQSVIFSPAALPGTSDYDELVKAGYVQEEYFLSGTANLYSLGSDGRAVVKTSGIPYTTHLVVVRPRDAARFSGTVQLTTGHPLYGMLQFGRISRYVLSHGDIYVGLMSGGDTLTRGMSKPGAPVSSPLVPRWFDPVRYAAIRWPADDGIRWDVYSDAARLLKSDDPHSPLAGLKVRRLYASGWSYLGSYLRSFIQYGFHDRLRDAGGRPIIDGYLIGISSGSVEAGHLPISTAEDHPPRPPLDAVLPRIDVPVIELQSENESFTNTTPQTPEIDSVAGGHRLWEVGGDTHTDIGRTEYAPARMQALAKLGQAEPASPCDLAMSDVAMADVAAAALADLDRWVETGTPPPSAAPIPIDPHTRQAAKDGVGNALGGVRLPQLEVPLARYGAAADQARCPSGNNFHFLQMKRTPLDRATLAQRYPGGRAEYLARFDAVTAVLVAQHWLRPEDAERERADARRLSQAIFTR